MKKVCVIGHFGFGKEMLNGQTVKTKTVTAELEKHYGEDQVAKIDTHGGLRVLPKVIKLMLRGFAKCENIIIFPAHNGVRVFAPLCAFHNQFYHRKLHYVVIGGWLPELTKGNAVLRSALKKLNYIYVETSTMKRSLEKQGFKNVVILPNFKDLRILPESELVYPQGEPYRLCTFSRVMKEKGIGDAVEAVKAVNEKLGRTAFALDIFGQVDSGQTDWFERLTESFPEYIHYRGCVPFNKSVGILKDYFCLLFPTRFFTEGIPGTILDAYAAGVPVISARWESFSDVVDDGVTGIGFDFCNQSNLEKTLYKVANEPNLVLEKKKSCVSAARKYTPNEAMCVLYRRFTR